MKIPLSCNTLTRLAGRCLRATFLLSFAMLALDVEFARAQVPEYNVKAGYLLLFTRYVEWPEKAFQSADAPLTIAVLGDDPFGHVLDDTVRDQISQGRRVRIVRARTVEELTDSHLVFIGRGSQHELAWLEALRDRPVLTVVESADVAEAGGVVQFVVERSSVRFIVSRPAARRAQLGIRTPMLLAAHTVRDTQSNVGP
jgi:hypothetical protein